MTQDTLRIVEKNRRLASPREGQRQSWTEYQVVFRRRVLSRHDTPHQAERHLAKLKATSAWQ